MSFIKFDNIVKLFTKYWEKFLVTGVSYTLLLAAITVAFGAVIACLLAGMKMSKIAPLRWLSSIYIEVIRGTPMLLQLYFFFLRCPRSSRRSTSRNFSASPSRSFATAPPTFPRSSAPGCNRWTSGRARRR